MNNRPIIEIPWTINESTMLGITLRSLINLGEPEKARALFEDYIRFIENCGPIPNFVDRLVFEITLFKDLASPYVDIKTTPYQ